MHGGAKGSGGQIGNTNALKIAPGASSLATGSGGVLARLWLAPVEEAEVLNFLTIAEAAHRLEAKTLSPVALV